MRSQQLWNGSDRDNLCWHLLAAVWLGLLRRLAHCLRVQLKQLGPRFHLLRKALEPFRGSLPLAALAVRRALLRALLRALVWVLTQRAGRVWRGQVGSLALLPVVHLVPLRRC